MLKLQFTYLSKFLPRLAKEKEKKRSKVKKRKGSHSSEYSSSVPCNTYRNTDCFVLMKHRSGICWTDKPKTTLKQPAIPNKFPKELLQFCMSKQWFVTHLLPLTPALTSLGLDSGS